MLGSGRISAQWLTFTNKGYDVVYTEDRVELCDPLRRLVLAPGWPLITWTEAERAKGQAWGLKTIESFHTHGTPPVTG